ncbi:MAG: hypothetical protein HY074_14305 [Deltaproteobacteria bacterium]|nr:hypothetical protein [Deltaproteobacteria bacterium]
MKQQIRKILIQFTLVFSVSVLVVACGKSKSKEVRLGAYGANPERTYYEVQCVTQPPPAAPSGASAIDPGTIPLPTPLPSFTVPIEVQSCDGLGGEPPHFYGRTMPGLVAVADCNAKIVRFRSRDWQVGEASSIGPNGEFDLNVMYITRLTADIEGNANCWTRLQGHVTGHATCPGDPNAAHLDFHVSWKFDTTPPEIMETPPAGLADLRNGKNCKILPSNCTFTNTAAVGCGG